MKSQQEVVTWTCEQVYDWAKTIVEEEYAHKLLEEKVKGTMELAFPHNTGTSLVKFAAEDFKRCAIPMGPAVELNAAVRLILTHSRKAWEPPDFVLSKDMVTSFVSDGLLADNFYSSRKPAVSEIIRALDRKQRVLVSSPPFTGKTSLCALVHLQLLEEKKRVCFFNLLKYDSSKYTILEWMQARSSEQPEKIFESEEPLYLLFDETQVLYPTTEKQMEQLKCCENADIPNRLYALNKFWQYVKDAPRAQTRILCFASYGRVSPSDTLLSTPFNFERRLSFSNFTDSDLDELFADFSCRTQNAQLRKPFPNAAREKIVDLTNGHVGYVSAILHYLNTEPSIHDELSMLRGLESYGYSDFALCQRITPNWFSLTLEQREELVRIWCLSAVPFDEHNPSHEFFIRKGWLAYADGNREVIALPCPLSKQLFLSKLHIPNRPLEDHFTHLTDFMWQFLRTLSKDRLATTLSKEKCGDKLLMEKFWQVKL